MKILLVDDSRYVRLTVKKHIMSVIKDEPVFIEADCGKEGISLYEKEHPELVFLDLLMPDINGEEVLKVIREKDKSCFIVVLSSNFQTPVKERLMTLGANQFFEKAITPEKMSDILDLFYAHNSSQ